MFHKLFKLYNNKEKTSNSDTYIFRQIKLKKELNKIKKKVHGQLSLDEL